MLKNGPENIPEVIKDLKGSGNKFTDKAFSGDRTSIDYFTRPSEYDNFKSYFNDGYRNYHYARLDKKFENGSLFGPDGEPVFNEVRQGGAGTCYIM